VGLDGLSLGGSAGVAIKDDTVLAGIGATKTVHDESGRHLVWNERPRIEVRLDLGAELCSARNLIPENVSGGKVDHGSGGSEQRRLRSLAGAGRTSQNDDSSGHGSCVFVLKFVSILEGRWGRGRRGQQNKEQER
jgi:hypothetical protein